MILYSARQTCALSVSELMDCDLCDANDATATKKQVCIHMCVSRCEHNVIQIASVAKLQAVRDQAHHSDHAPSQNNSRLAKLCPQCPLCRSSDIRGSRSSGICGNPSESIPNPSESVQNPSESVRICPESVQNPSRIRPESV